MQTEKNGALDGQPLSGCRVIEYSNTASAAYAGRMLAAMGAQVTLVESANGSALRAEAPTLRDTGESALFAYLAAGKHSWMCDLESEEGREAFQARLGECDILIHDVPNARRADMGLDPDMLQKALPDLIQVSVLPFGSSGPKAGLVAQEVNLIHASGEGYLLPNGLSHEVFPGRPPLKIYGHFAQYQGGCMAALAALSAWWALPQAGGQFIDVSVQDAMLLVGSFALQRLGDGSLEHRSTRKFRYGGVFETQDGYIELLMLEDRQWQALVELMGKPDWTQTEPMLDPLERGLRGDEINSHLRVWMAEHKADEIVEKAQRAGVPVAKYRSASEVYTGEHERARGLFAPSVLPGGQRIEVLRAPFAFMRTPLSGDCAVPSLGQLNEECELS